MRRGLLAAGLVAVAALVAHGPAAWACSCAVASTQQHYKAADAVFVGTVTTVEYPPTRDGIASGGNPARAGLSVGAVFKGTVGRSARVATALDEASCGVPFVPGKRYAVFADSTRDGLRADTCGGTTDDLRALARAGYVTSAHSHDPLAVARPATRDGNVRAGVIGAALFLAAAAGTAVFFRRRAARG